MAVRTLPPQPRRNSNEMRRAAVAEGVESLLSRAQSELMEHMVVPIPREQGVREFVLPVGDVSRDIRYAASQFSFLQKNDLPVLAAEVSLASPENQVGEPIVVPLEIPGLGSLGTSYDDAQESALRAGFRVVALSISEGISALRTGLIEFLDARLVANMSTGFSGAVPTVVDSKRAGDTVLYAKGYFISTRQGFGVSRPAHNHLLPGRYSFGIMVGSNPQFDPVLWSIPHPNSIWLPLP